MRNATRRATVGRAGYYKLLHSKLVQLFNTNVFMNARVSHWTEKEIFQLEESIERNKRELESRVHPGGVVSHACCTICTDESMCFSKGHLDPRWKDVQQEMGRSARACYLKALEYVICVSALPDPTDPCFFRQAPDSTSRLAHACKSTRVFNQVRRRFSSV